MVIISNFHAFPREWQTANGERGTSRQANSAREFLEFAAREPDCLCLVNCNPSLTLELCAARLFGRLKAPIVCVDLVLRTPRTALQKATLVIKKLLLRQV